MNLVTLRRRRAEAQLALAKATIAHRGARCARRQLVAATADLIRAELNRRKAEPLLRSRANSQQTGDLFSQAGI